VNKASESFTPSMMPRALRDLKE